MIFDYNRLKSRIRAKGYTYTSFAKAIEISNNSLSEKLNKGLPFRHIEMYKAKELLDLKNVDDYFFVKRA